MSLRARNIPGITRTAIACVLLLTALPLIAGAATAPAPQGALPTLDIPNTRYVLPNGLTLVVHEDHKAPIVAINIWYHVGSKNEPAGRTGFAHLFEHLMFGGRNANQKGWFERMEAMGATDLNGTTWYDRTNFFETVPTAALDTALFMESQRMGHLLDDFSEQVLTTQRGVVQNEKRQNDNRPYHVAEDVIIQSVWPAAHPYSHSVIGEMTDLDAASVANVRQWFASYYGPTNAVIVLAGDISAAEARAKVEKYFGDIAPGSPVARQRVWIAKRNGEQRASVQDRVPLARLYKVWNVPPDGTVDSDYLEMLSNILDDGKDSRLYRRLVYQDQMASTVEAELDGREIASLFRVEITAKSGVELSTIEKTFDEELARLLRDGPTAAEVARAKTSLLAGAARGMERVGGFGGKSDVLAESQTYRDSPDAWKRSIEHWRGANATDLTSAGRRWLSDGAFVLELTPYPSYAATATGLDRRNVPTPGSMKPPGLPHFQRATLANGLKVMLVERHATPTVELRLVLDAGRASDQFGKPGVAGLTGAMLEDGTQTLDALQFSDRLLDEGATFEVSTDWDATYVNMNALSSRLDASLNLLADAVLHPGFRNAELAREIKLASDRLAQSKQNPPSAATRLAPALVYGVHHAYGVLSTEATLAAITAQDVQHYHTTWFVPNAATLVVVGDTNMATLQPLLEARFGAWKPGSPPRKNINAVATPSTSVLYLIDKPGAVQSFISANVLAPPRRDADDLAISAMNTVLGGAFTSRLNMNLREDKHWSYGAGSRVSDARGPGLFAARASVQTDRTHDSIVEMRRELQDIIATRPVSAEEMLLAQQDLTLSLPGRWESSGAVAATLGSMVVYDLPDDYYDSYVERILALTPADGARGAHRVIKPAAMTWVVVGDREKIEPGLRSLGLEVKIVDADGDQVP